MKTEAEYLTAMRWDLYAGPEDCGKVTAWFWIDKIHWFAVMRFERMLSPYGSQLDFL